MSGAARVYGVRGVVGGGRREPGVLGRAGRAGAACALAWLAGCAQMPPRLPFEHDLAWPAADLLLLGEQHDAPDHQRLAARVVAQLAAHQRLAAVAIEMAEQGRSTVGLPTDASDAAARAALVWDERGWPWQAYGPIVMSAVRQGVPVVGANLPRPALRDAAQDPALDDAVPAAVRERLRTDVRDGHCGLLPDAQLPGMTRIQIARDRTLADTLRALARPGRVVLLVAGANHVDASRGVPLHLRAAPPVDRLYTVRLAAGAKAGDATPGFDETWPTAAVSQPDPCVGLAGQMAR